MLNNANKDKGTAFLLVKMIVVLLVGFAAYRFASFLMVKDIFTAPINIFYLTLVGLMLGYILGTPIASYFELVWNKFQNYMSTISPQTVLAAGLGLTLALVVSVLLNTLLENYSLICVHIRKMLLAIRSWFKVDYCFLIYLNAV